MSKTGKKVSYSLLAVVVTLGSCYYLYKKNQSVQHFIHNLIGINEYSEGDGKEYPTITSDNKNPKALKPDKYFLIDDHARKTPKQFEKDIKTLSQYLTKAFTSEIDKARVLFTWVATHIHYDDNSFNSDSYPDYSAEYVLTNKKAVCEGYSNIYKALCESSGLQCEKITGYAKGYGYNIGDKFSDTDHAWNAVKVDNIWRLVDVTWASGFGTNKNGKLVSTQKFEPFWFFTNSYAFIFTHLPSNPQWQLVSKKLTLNQYENLPFLNESLFKLGFNAYNIYNDATSGIVKQFAEAYPLDFPITAIQLPYSLNLLPDKETTFKIQSEYTEEIALVDGNDWHYLKKDNDIFTTLYRPRNKKLQVCVKINSFDPNFHTILQYNIVAAGAINSKH